MQILKHTHIDLQHATYWPHVQSSGRFASKPHSRELPDELNASCIMVKYHYFFVLHVKYLGIQMKLLVPGLVSDAKNTVSYVNVNVIIIWGGNIQAPVSFITWN